MFRWLRAWQRRGIVRRVPLAQPVPPTREEAIIERLAAAVASLSRRDRIRVETGLIARGSSGFTHVLGQKPYRDSVFVRGLTDPDGFGWKVRLNMRDRPDIRVVTLAHEVAHVYCGHCGPSHAGDWPDRRAMNRMTQELEAETAAGVFAVMANLVSSAPQRLESLLAEARTQMNAHHQVDLNLVRVATERICREAGLPTPHQGWFSRDPDLRRVAISGKGSDS